MSRAVDHRSDIFSLAIVLHEMLTGDRPFQGKSTMELIFEINRGTPVRLREARPDLTWSLEALLLRMLEKNPDDRIQSMPMVRASLAAIERELQHREVEAAVAGKPTAEVEQFVRAREDAPSSKLALAVLRFRAVPPGPEAEAFADGLAAETIQALGGVPHIRVASRLAASHFEDGSSSLEVASRVLGVSYVLTGTVRHSRDRVRVLCEVADTLRGTQLWSHSYQSSGGDPFDAQEEIARSIAAGVSGALLTIGAQHVPSGKPNAPALVRRAHRAVFAVYSRSGIAQATALIREAIAVSPDYGPAYAYLGVFLQQRVINGFSEDPERDRAEALGSVERALQLDPSDAEILQNAGLVFIHQSRTERAIGVLRRCVEIAEFNLVAWGYLALALGWTGGEKEMDEAQSICDRLILKTSDHPSIPYWLYFQSGICFRQGKYDKGLDCARRCVERQPQFLVGMLSYANALGLTGRHAEALEVVGTVMAMSSGASQQLYIRELTYVAGTPDRVRPHIAGLIAAGIFQGE
jgi:adenylate cyclase